MLDNDIVGKADTFISHSWGVKFGDLVAAICDNCGDRSRKVWVDIFAVRQWPTTKPDLDFEVVSRQCSSFLVFCLTIPAVEKMHHEVPVEVRPYIPFFRVWCLCEVFYAAITEGIAIVMKAGHYSLLEESSYCFINNREMLKNLSDSIDVRQAGATNPADKAFIFGKIEASKTMSQASITSCGASCLPQIRNYNPLLAAICIGKKKYSTNPQSL